VKSTSGRPFAVFDIDGTRIRWQLYHAIVDELGDSGHLAPGLHDEIRKARLTWKTRTHKDSFKEYEEKLVEVYYRALTGLPVNAYDAAIDRVFNTYKDQVYTYTRDLIRTLKADGYHLFVLSGSHQEIITKLGSYYGFEEAIGTQFEQKNGVFTGKYQLVYGRKAELLAGLVEKYGLSKKGSIAVGDSESDIQMLDEVETPIAFNPSKGLLEYATKYGWKVVVERKNVVYELEKHGKSYVLAATN
jgi:HAD superfamily hydrolase (TIGR01490 family)